MDIIVRGLLILVLIFLLEVFLYNFLKPDLPRIPGDIWIEKPGITLYIPFASALFLSVLTIIFLEVYGSFIP